jgi:Zn-dependent protease
MALCRLFGIQLEVHVTFFLLLGYVGLVGWQEAGARGLMAGVTFILLVFGCVVLHELGHSLTARRFGIRVPRILLLPIGGMAQFDSIPRQPSREFLIAVAGPAVNFALLGLGLLIAGWPDSEFWELVFPRSARDYLHALVVMNLVMGCFNLLPVFPMDGGRILRALLATRFTYLAATRVAARVGQTLAALGVGVALFWGGSVLTAILFAFIFVGAELEYRFVERSERFVDLLVGDVTRRDYVAVPAEATVEAALAALQHAQPQDVLVFEAGLPCGVLARDRLAGLMREGRQREDSGRHADRTVPALQAEWPLAPFTTQRPDGMGTLYPVYSGEQFVGVLDLRHIDELAALARSRAPLGSSPLRPPPVPGP